MQKIFYVNTAQNNSFVQAELREINEFIKNSGKIISVTSSISPGKFNTIDWLVVADDGQDTNINV